jgi:hypothetical protein
LRASFPATAIAAQIRRCLLGQLALPSPVSLTGLMTGVNM